MTPLVPIMLFGWPLICIHLFKKLIPQKAIIITVFGGFMFLPPKVSYPLPLIPDYDKYMVIAISILLGQIFIPKDYRTKVKIEKVDIPIIVWCSLSPIMTSLTNGLGLYDGIHSAFSSYFMWGLFYYIGKKYFASSNNIKELVKAFIVGGLIYIPLCLYEIRFSPQLSVYLFGYFPSTFGQHMRYGGFRPIVFMNHGLMVALFMVSATIAAFWLWRSKKLESCYHIKMKYLVPIMIITTILCKSAGAIVFLLLGIVIYYLSKMTKSFIFVKLLIVLIPFYLLIRIFDLYSTNSILDLLSGFFDTERLRSLEIRLVQEDLFNSRTMLRAMWGWGGFRRGWPTNPVNTNAWIGVVDSLQVIISNQFGLVGVMSLGFSLYYGSWKVLKYTNYLQYQKDSSAIYYILLAIISIFFMYDSLLNGMPTPMYILSAGALMNSRFQTTQQMVNTDFLHNK